MDTSFDFRNLFVLDLANNHQGDFGHALRVIEGCGRVVGELGVRAALKFQFRHLDTFVHPRHRVHSDNKHLPRFLSTALTRSDYAQLAKAVSTAGMLTMATPFDEESVDLINVLDIEIIKVASCSAVDWPLLERIALENKPVIVSTGGQSLESIDDLVSFFDHKRVHFALMHCVSVYPTPDDDLQLAQIEVLRRRYPDKVVGFSTHESPDNTAAVMIAVAKGAEILERHVGIATPTIQLNAYSSTPDQLAAWLHAARRAKSISGTARRSCTATESAALRSLQRGIFARAPIAPGTVVRREDVYFAMPLSNGGLPSGLWREGMTAKTLLEQDAPLSPDSVELPSASPKVVLFQTIHAVKAMLNEARIALPTDFKLEFSHHYGIERFREVGAVLIECVNRDYCKKLIVQLPGQKHPNHYHKKKEETFQVLSGILEAEIEGRKRRLYPGDTIVVPQGVWHSFWTDGGVIFEEISSTHFNDDSFYEDKRINATHKGERKTIVTQWGRYQL